MCAVIKHSTTARKFLCQFSPHPRWRLKRSFNWANGSTLLLESEGTPLVVAADLFPLPLKTQEAKHCETDFPVSTLVTSALMTATAWQSSHGDKCTWRRQDSISYFKFNRVPDTKVEVLWTYMSLKKKCVQWEKRAACYWLSFQN